MIALASDLYQIFLGWVKNLAAEVYLFVSEGEWTGVLSLLSRSWGVILLAMLLFGLLADNAVYWFRWRPFEVWKSFFRRLHSGRRHEEAAPIQRVMEVSQSYVPPEDDVYHPPEGATVYTPDQLTYAPSPTDIVYNYEAKASEDDPEMLDDAFYEEPARPRSRRAHRRYFRLPNILADTEEDGPQLRYRAPRQTQMRGEAFHAPYIPPQYQPPKVSSSMTGLRRRREKKA